MTDAADVPGGGRPVLPASPAPGADYVRARRHGQTLYLAGQLPFVDGQLLRTGRVGDGLGRRARRRHGDVRLSRREGLGGAVRFPIS